MSDFVTPSGSTIKYTVADSSSCHWDWVSWKQPINCTNSHLDCLVFLQTKVYDIRTIYHVKMSTHSGFNWIMLKGKIPKGSSHTDVFSYSGQFRLLLRWQFGGVVMELRKVSKLNVPKRMKKVQVTQLNWCSWRVNGCKWSTVYTHQCLEEV